MNLSERSTEYESYTIVADDPLPVGSGVGNEEIKTAGWFVPCVHVARTEYEKSMKPSEWEKEIADSESWEHLKVPSRPPMATKKEAVEDAIRFAKEAIDFGFNQKKS